MTNFLEFYREQVWDFYWTEYVWQVLWLLFLVWFVCLGVVTLVYFLLRKNKKGPIDKPIQYANLTYFTLALLFFIVDVYSLDQRLTNSSGIVVTFPRVDSIRTPYSPYPDTISSMDGELKKEDVLAELYVIGYIDSPSVDILDTNSYQSWFPSLETEFYLPLVITKERNQQPRFDVRVAPQEDYHSFSSPMAIDTTWTMQLSLAYKDYIKHKHPED